MKLPLKGVLLAALVAIAPVFADQLQLKPDAPQSYVVKKGDTLWDISSLYLASPWKWPELWSWNPQIQNPHLIYPGDMLALQYGANGEPQLKLVKGVVKLSPQVRLETKDVNAIPTIALHIIEPFLGHELSIVESEIDSSALPMVLGSNNNVKINTKGQLLYTKGNVVVNALYGIYRRGEDYKSLVSNEVLATKLQLTGVARGVRAGELASGLPATILVEQVKQEIRPGDLLLPLNKGSDLSAQFKMARPDEAISGQIIGSSNPLRFFGKMSVVVLDLGKDDKVTEGHIFDILKQSPTVIEGQHGPRYLEDANRLEKFVKAASELFGTENTQNSTVWTMPKEKVGELMVFRVFEKVSYALVTNTKEPVRVGDFVEVLPN